MGSSAPGGPFLMKKICLLLACLALSTLSPRAQGDGFPRERRAGHPNSPLKDAAEGKRPPGLGATDWHNTPNGRDVRIGELRGKVVVVIFFGAFSPLSCDVVRDLGKLHGELHEKGLEVLAIHSSVGATQFPRFVEQNPLPFPVALDARGDSVRNFLVDDYPDIWMIDRAGNVRVADLANTAVEAAARELLQEPVPPTTFPYPKRLVGTWPAARYTVKENGEAIGFWKTSISLKGEGGDERLLLRDEYELSGARGRLELTCDLTPDLVPETLVAEGATEARLTFHGDRTSGTKELTYARPPMTELTLLRGPGLPFRKGQSVTFDHLSVHDLELTGGWTLTCAGETPLEVAGRRVFSWRFELTGPGGAGTLWFGRERQLLRMVRGTREWVLDALPR